MGQTIELPLPVCEFS